MKKVKMIELYNSVGTLNKILEEKMPLKTTTKIHSLIKEINTHLKNSESVRTELLEKYGKKNKNGEYNVPDNKKEAFMDELNTTLFQKEIELYSPLLKVEDFNENFLISASDFSLISYLVEE